jgi:hypothetical protein
MDKVFHLFLSFIGFLNQSEIAHSRVVVVVQNFNFEQR